jgi:molybdenum cofactor cytidylyltransferase
MMDILTAFRLRNHTKIAVVGAGGKTSTCIRLAEAFKTNVVITTTTHVGISQFDGVAGHHIVQSPADVDAALTEAQKRPVLITSTSHDGIRSSALSPDLMDHLLACHARSPFTLIVEADGARGLALKAPGANEPQIPPWAEEVIVCAGMSALGQFLSADLVHRPEIFSQFSGLAVGDEITPAAMIKVLTDPQGGLKGIPSRAGKTLLLNQADDDIRQAQAAQIAPEALSHGFDRVVVASLGADSPSPAIYSRFEPAAGIILAAGSSTRMGQPKQLLEVDGKPLGRRMAEIALDSGLSPVIVVTGAYAEEIGRALDGLPVKIAHNPAFLDGQSTSVLAGMRILPMRTGAVLYILTDQPYVDASLMRAVVERWQTTGAQIVAPLVADQRANPVLFDRSTFDDFATLTGDQGAKSLLRKYKVEYLPWHDERVLLDLDTMEDYVKFKNS